MQPRVIAGWRVLLKINSEQVLPAFAVDYYIDTSGSLIQGVDNVFPEEISPDRVDVGMTLRVYRTPDNDPVALLHAPGGDLAGQGNPQKSFSEAPYISVEVRDRITDKTVLFLPKAWVTRRSGSVDAEGLLVETWTIRSIGFIGSGN